MIQVVHLLLVILYLVMEWQLAQTMLLGEQAGQDNKNNSIIKLKSILKILGCFLI